ncbi:MAP7 domain-containing protein 2 isoform X2 [Scleropages formosus]|uniref:MAP7 domain-containing protein 2 isoform X2 n=1 Tax=Scleropages formosus TaxID=113540 RepID=UPI000878C4E0|nr:MAP7 domain-containing protein 2 isoform X2 [Scleropages formosus]
MDGQMDGRPCPPRREGQEATEQSGSGPRRRSHGSVRESLFFPVLERNEQQRLDALSRSSPERSLQHDVRPKRWTWGGDYENDLRCDVSPSSTSSESNHVSPSPHRPSASGPPSDAENGKSRVESPAATPKAPAMETSGAEKASASLLRSSSARRPDSPATPSRRSSPRPLSQSLGTPRRSRRQSPCATGPHPSSPLKNGPSWPSADLSRKPAGEEKEVKGHGSSERKASKAETTERKMPKSVSRERAMGAERSADASPVTPTGKPVAGTTDAEEASRLLAERRRQARQQKEQEERQRREQEEEERLRVEEEQRRLREERARLEEEARQKEEQRQREELERRRVEEEERRLKERRWRELQAQLEREKEEMDFRAQKEAERQQQEREMLKLQEDEERLQRKKRIEEIMRRTRKTGAEGKKDAVWAEPASAVSHVQSFSSPLLGLPGIGQVNTVVNIQVSGPGLEQLPPSFGLGLLGVQSRGADELADEVQAMDVSPVSKDELTSNLPDNELQKSSTSNACALEDLLDITSQVSCPALSAGEPLGDCNKNLIEDFYPSAEAQLIQSFISSPDERNLQ